jgi:hypothetical protein
MNNLPSAPLPPRDSLNFDYRGGQEVQNARASVCSYAASAVTTPGLQQINYRPVSEVGGFGTARPMSAGLGLLKFPGWGSSLSGGMYDLGGGKIVPIPLGKIGVPMIGPETPGIEDPIIGPLL